MEQRLNQHALGWAEEAGTRIEALEFERRIKGWTRAKKEALIAGDWTEIGRLARPPRERPVSRSVRPELVEGNGDPGSVRPERSAQRVVEGPAAGTSLSRPSTSLRTNGDFSSGRSGEKP